LCSEALHLRTNLKIDHFIGIFSPEHGGPVVSCRNYVMGQARRGCDVTLFTLEGYPRTSSAVRLLPPVKQRVARVEWPEKLGASRGLRRMARQSPTADVYHLHGIWLRAMFYGYQESRVRARPYLIEINGALDPLELAAKPWRKRLIRSWFQDRMLREAACLHVNSKREAGHLRDLGFAGPLAIIPAGFNREEFDALGEKAEQIVPPWAGALAGRRVLLYLARIHPAKGIDDLLTSWCELARQFPEWDLLIVGPGEKSEIEERTARMAVAGVADRCHWVGMVSDIERAWAYRRADLYVLPSHKENFGNTVQEALGSGTAVLTTKATPWGELEAWGCGWLCDDNAESLGRALGVSLAETTESLKQRGAIGRRRILDDFSLDEVVTQQIAVYSWMAGGVRPRIISTT
jgi:glycosyltransferase involved in cell wall biosynthesis